MKVKINLELHLDIPGEFQDDHRAVEMIEQELRDQLYVGCDYDDTYQFDRLHVDEMHLRSYKVLSGKIAD